MSHVRCNVTVDFLLVSNSRHLSISHGLDVICTWKVSYHYKQCKNRISSSWFSREGYNPKQRNKVDWLNTLMQMSITINLTQYNQMLHNGYLLVELRRLVYALLEGSFLRVALGDNVLLTCSSIIRSAWQCRSSVFAFLILFIFFLFLFFFCSVPGCC